jgi:hypothetical protein
LSRSIESALRAISNTGIDALDIDMVGNLVPFGHLAAGLDQLESLSVVKPGDDETRGF